MSEGAVLIFQPAIPNYRLDFFDRLYVHYGGKLTVYYSDQPLGGLTDIGRRPSWAAKLGGTTYLPGGAIWQDSAWAVPISKNDTVVVNGAPRYLTNFMIIAKAKAKGARVVWWGHFKSSTSTAVRTAIRLIISRVCNGHMFYTEKEAEQYRRRFKSAVSVCGLNNGVNVDAVRPHRVDYSSSERPKDAIFIGRNTPKSNLELLLHAIPMMDPRLNLHVVGDVASNDRLADLCRQLGIRARVFFHGEIKDQREIAEIANRCRLFIYPGSVGLSLIHAFSFGLPAIIHDHRADHMPEADALIEGRNGAVFAKNSAESLANVTNSIIANEDLLDEYSKIAMATADLSFNTERMAEAFINLLGNLKGRRA